MLSYRHIFHAGNFADAFKHALLTRLVIALNAKPAPWCYLDTHAGIGCYDLTHAWAQKAHEYRTGIALLWKRRDLPRALLPYMDIVRAQNPDGRLRRYPGSPRIARSLARPQDRLVLIELNKTDHAELKAQFAGDRQTAVHLLDGYQALKAFLPPKERRGLVLLDSSFDRAGEFPRIVTALAGAHARWPTGVHAVWYPLMDPGTTRNFMRDLTATGIRRMLRLEMTVLPDDAQTMPGCGLIVVNPPWKFDTEARTLLRWLWGALSVAGAGGAKVEWLAPE